MTIQTSSYVSGFASAMEGSRRDHKVSTSSPLIFPLLLVVVLGAHCSLFASALVVIGPPEKGSRTGGLLEEFPLLPEDRYFWIENHGLTRVYVDLNGYKFTLTVDPVEVQQGSNMYLIQRQGDTTIIDMVAYMQSENNLMRITSRGPTGAEATVLVGDTTIVNSRIDYVLQLVPLPKSVALFQNYPNPFNLTTTIQYEIADNLVDGVDVQLTIFDILGRKVRTLVNDHRFHGAFSIQWDGLADGGAVAASGAYLYRLKAGNVVETKRLLLLK